jgi:hypothetical protein
MSRTGERWKVSPDELGAAWKQRMQLKGNSARRPRVTYSQGEETKWFDYH